MRRRIQTRIYPIDTLPSVAVGLRLPFDGVGVFGQNYTTQDQMKSNIINYMLTSPGERVFNPDFGAGIRDLLFSQENDLEAIDDALRTGISSQFPQISIVSLSVVAGADPHTINITLKYSFNNTPNQITVTI
jgi:hypothetical protein